MSENLHKRRRRADETAAPPPVRHESGAGSLPSKAAEAQEASTASGDEAPDTLRAYMV